MFHYRIYTGTTVGLCDTQSDRVYMKRSVYYTHERETERKESVGFEPSEGETVGALGGRGK